MTYRNALALAAMTAAVLAVGAARAEDYGPLQVIEAASGKVLADPKGMTLYTYDKDAMGKSNCSGECAEYWPPVLATSDAKPVGGLTIIKRDDGKMQWPAACRYSFTACQTLFLPSPVTSPGFLSFTNV